MIIWLPSRRIVAVVLSSIDMKAYVRVLWPISKNDNNEELIEDMTKVEGHYVQQCLAQILCQ
jgi:hypothetical protein